MLSPAHDIAKYLDVQGVGVLNAMTGWSINISREPMEPDNCVTVYDTGGLEPDTDELDLMHPTIQVRVRHRKLVVAGIDTGYELAYSKHEEIRDLLILGTPLITVDSTFVLINLVTEISAIGRDDNDRHLLVANYSTIRQRV
jgi:hypothetical protein